MSAISTSELFDPEFLAAIQRLHLQARRVPAGGRHAEQRSRARGTGLEFQDFRQYVPGDDFRTIDWTIYRRLGRVFVRMFEELQDLPVYLLPDVSQSMFLEDPPRAKAGLRCAFALAAIALNQHDSVGLFPFSDDVRVAVRPRAGKQSLMHFARAMSELEVGGATDLRKSLERFDAMRLRTGLCVIVSDMFDPGGIEAVVGALRNLRHRPLIVKLERESDRAPALRGDLQLRDCEDGNVLDVSVTPSVLQRYEKAFARFESTLLDYAQKRGIGVVQVDVEQPVLPQLGKLFGHGRLLV